MVSCRTSFVRCVWLVFCLFVCVYVCVRVCVCACVLCAYHYQRISSSLLAIEVSTHVMMDVDHDLRPYLLCILQSYLRFHFYWIYCYDLHNWSFDSVGTHLHTTSVWYNPSKTSLWRFHVSDSCQVCHQCFRYVMNHVISNP